MAAPRISPVWLVLLGIGSVQFGAAIAKGLFAEIGPTSMVFLRLATSALVLLVLARPRLAARTRADWQVAIGFGLTLGTMNWAIYQSFARIPLGLAVTIEFIGPLLVAVAGSQRPRDVAWVVLAGVGVAALGAEPGDVTLPGVLYALLAAAAWAGYIWASAQTGRRWPGLDGLAVASAVATLGLAPYAVLEGGSALLEPRILLTGAAVGLLSSVVPYSLELIALRTLAPAVFGILMSLEPAAAALAGMVVLGEFLGPVQWFAVLSVVAASVGAARGAARPPVAGPAPD